MDRMPHEVRRMGPALRLEVERQLLADLSHYGVDPNDLRIDWTDACQEGHCTSILGGQLEGLSGVSVRSSDASLVAAGWMDFVHGGESNPLFVFWLFLTLASDSQQRRGKSDPGIPEHIWESLPEQTKWLCARTDGYDARWAQDAKIIAWKKSRAS
jgi:hypothetical protein